LITGGKKVKMNNSFHREGIYLTQNISIPIGLKKKNEHKFDLGSLEKKIIVECKSHTWTAIGTAVSS